MSLRQNRVIFEHGGVFYSQVLLMTVVLSEQSQALIKQLNICQQTSDNLFVSGVVDSSVLILWLTEEPITPTDLETRSKKELEFLLVALRASLLSDLFIALKGDNAHLKKVEEPATTTNKLKFIFLSIAGTLFAACEGFDSISTMMGIFSLPSIAILLVGIVFSALSVLVFYGFDLIQVSHNLGIKLSDAPKLLDVYYEQMQEINAIRKKVNTYLLAQSDIKELEGLEQLVFMLQTRMQSLMQASKQFSLSLKSTKVTVMKGVVTGIAGLLFFGGGFFAGQSVALFVMGLFTAAVLPASWPVIVFSVLIGLAAFSIYWYVERVGVTQLISSLFGLDEEKMDKLCDKDYLAKEENKLANLKEKIQSSAVLSRQLTALKQKNTIIDTVVIENVSKEEPLCSVELTETYQKNAGIHGFYYHPESAKNNVSVPFGLGIEESEPRPSGKLKFCDLANCSAS